MKTIALPIVIPATLIMIRRVPITFSERLTSAIPLTYYTSLFTGSDEVRGSIPLGSIMQEKPIQ